MATTTFATFQPLGIGELLDQAIRLYRNNFLRFIGIFAIIQVPLSLVSLVATTLTTSNALTNLSSAVDNGGNFDPLSRMALANGAVTLVIGLLSFVLVQGMATAALTRTIVDERIGRTTGILEAYRKIFSNATWLQLIGALFLLGLASLLVLIWALVPCVGWVSGFGMLAFLSLVIGQLIAPIVVVENPGASNAIRRGWDLSRRRFWWTLGFVGVLTLLSYLIIAGPAVLVSSLANMLTAGSLNATQTLVARQVISSLVTMIFSVLWQPLQMTAITLLYFDLRVRTEGLDLTLDTQQEAGTSIEIDLLQREAPEASHDPLITGREFGYFVIMSLVVVVIWVVLFGLLAMAGFLLAAAGSGL